jgi:heat shock protein HslJ
MQLIGNIRRNTKYFNQKQIKTFLLSSCLYQFLNMKASRIVLLIFFLGSVILTSACQSRAPQKQQTINLSNSSWQLTGIHNKQVMTSSMGEGIFLTFEAFENQVSGFAGCNRFFGNYQVGENGTLTLNAIGSTKMMCRNMATETEFLNTIRMVNQYKITGQTLEFYQNETRLATFTKIPYRK